MSGIQNTPNDVIAAGVSDFASHALTVIADEVRRTKNERGIDIDPLPLPLATLQSVVVQRTPDKAVDVVERMLRSGISKEEIVDLYIPQVARDLGQAWVDDEMSFATVTIGCARLQGVLRSVGEVFTNVSEVTTLMAPLPRCRILVPQTEQHTLGATVFANQLRRSGVASDLDLQADLSSELPGSGSTRYEAIMISASSRLKNADLKQFVEQSKDCYGDIPVLIGGSILLQNDDVKAQSGANFATNNLSEAISFCGFDKIKLKRSPLRLEP